MLLDLASLFVFFEHLRGWVHLHSPLIAQVAEVVVVNVAFMIRIEVLEDHGEVFRTQCNFQSLECDHKLVEGDLPSHIHVEETESWANGIESFHYSDPNEL